MCNRLKKTAYSENVVKIILRTQIQLGKMKTAFHIVHQFDRHYCVNISICPHITCFACIVCKYVENMQDMLLVFYYRIYACARDK